MTDISILDDVTVELVQSVGDDAMICRAARVSTLGAASVETSEAEGLINFLMRGRHGSPFEHASLTYLIKAPIFTWREHMRHRIGHSYNEQSGRYMELSPEFYIPREDRPLVQVGKAGAYSFVPGNELQYEVAKTQMEAAYNEAWTAYQTMLKHGIAKEVARMVLPVGIFSSAYVTVNPRSLMAFLSLRTKDDGSLFPSFPQAEIEYVAKKMEAIFKGLFPLTHAAFIRNQRVAP